MSVVFTCPSVGSKFVGTLTLTSNDPIQPTTTLVFGAEGVPVGMRVLVLQADGTPYPTVDEIKYKSNHEKLQTRTNLPLTTIDPPDSWLRIQYHYQSALRPTDDGDMYVLTVTVGDKSQTITFTLGANEFKQIVITLP